MASIRWFGGPKGLESKYRRFAATVQGEVAAERMAAIPRKTAKNDVGWDSGSKYAFVWISFCRMDFEAWMLVPENCQEGSCRPVCRSCSRSP
jgi:hypothetical protein